MSVEGVELEGQPHSKVGLDLGSKKAEVSGLTRRRLAAGAVLGAGVAIGLTVLGRQLGVDVAPIGAASAGLSSMGAVILPEAILPGRKLRPPGSPAASEKERAKAGAKALVATGVKARADVAVMAAEAKTAEAALRV